MSINPLRLREYIASGVPVVSTPLTEARKFESTIHVAGSVESFVASVVDAAHKGFRAGLPEVLNEESWTDKSELLSKWLMSKAFLSWLIILFFYLIPRVSKGIINKLGLP